MNLTIESGEDRYEMDSEKFGMMSWIERYRVCRINVNQKCVSVHYNNRDGSYSMKYNYEEIGEASEFIRKNFIPGDTLFVTAKRK